ncbi:MAG TPA: hypothetical protein VFA11_11510 [Acidimicrobiales bacterium]|nr:hypothetical protein [Acidimicrobiales bacterium]
MSLLPLELGIGWERVRGVVRRWWVLLFIGTVLGLGVAAALTATAAVTSTSTAVVTVNQPRFLIDPGFGQQTVNKLNGMMPTFASLATSDQVLQQVEDQTGVRMALKDLRTHVTVTVPPATLDLQIAVQLSSGADAQAVAQGIIANLQGQLATFGGAGAPADEQIVLSTLQAPVTVRDSRHATRNLTVAGILGFGLAAMVAFAVDRA